MPRRSVVGRHIVAVHCPAESYRGPHRKVQRHVTEAKASTAEDREFERRCGTAACELPVATRTTLEPDEPPGDIEERRRPQPQTRLPIADACVGDCGELDPKS